MKKILFSSLFTIILLFSITLPAFAGAYTVADTWSLKSMSVVPPPANVTMTYYPDSKFTKVVNNLSTDNVEVVYRLNDSNKWISGYSYKINFQILKTSKNVGLALCTSTTPDLSNGSSQTYITNDTILKVGDYSFTFTYTGQPYLIVIFTMPGTANIHFGDFTLYKYNQNAELESQNQQIIEQNSELQSQLFEEGETFSMPDIDLSEQYSEFDSQSKDLISDGQSILQSNRIVNGVKSFATIFTAFYSSMQSDEVLQAFPLLMYLTLICSLILLIFGFLRSRGDK